MRALLTGGSSFTGLWFAEALAAAGFEVVAPLRGARATGAPLRDARAERLAAVAETVAEAPFGAPAFLAALDDGLPFDLLCLHGAPVGDYRDPAYDVAGALAEATRGAAEVFARFAARGGRAAVLTGTVFEPGAGGAAEAGSAYGLAKGFIGDLLAWRAAEAGVAAARYIVANPFGPWEEDRLCAYLARCWLAGEVPALRGPDYVRDNAPADLLAADYAAFARGLAADPAPRRRAPSVWPETVAGFARRLGDALGPRLGVATPVAAERPARATEPLRRVNADPVDAARLGWRESAFWDSYAAHRRLRFAGARPSEIRS